MTQNFYDFKAVSLQGKEISMESYKGKVVLVVNTASKCGLTPQFEGLEKLYKQYKDKGLVILGFPCNQFANQEPGSAEEHLGKILREEMSAYRDELIISTKAGYDIALMRQINDRVNIPTIASGGVGNLQHLADGILKGGADAVLAASIFHFGQYTIPEAKQYLAAQGIEMRL